MSINKSTERYSIKLTNQSKTIINNCFTLVYCLQVLSNTALSTGKQALEKRLFVGQHGSEIYALPTLFDPRSYGEGTRQISGVIREPEVITSVIPVVPVLVPTPVVVKHNESSDNPGRGVKTTAITTKEVGPYFSLFDPLIA